ncbi:MAG: hypothetical protein R3E96_13410 [Planctomycetota bacterium]
MGGGCTDAPCLVAALGVLGRTRCRVGGGAPDGLVGRRTPSGGDDAVGARRGSGLRHLRLAPGGGRDWGWILALLAAGRPVVVGVEETLPEWFDCLYRALLAVGAPVEGLMPICAPVELLRRALPAPGDWPLFVAYADSPSLRRLEKWNSETGGRPRSAASGVPFGFGVATPARAGDVQLHAMQRKSLTMPADADLEEWLDLALESTFGPPVWGGLSADAAATWHVPATRLSELTARLLQRLEEGSAAVPEWVPYQAEEVSQAQRFALGKGATLIHEATSTPSGRSAIIPRQIFTTVEADTAEQLACRMTPTLALCRGEHPWRTRP